ncbi:MAG: tyrosine-type recombinase/integrase [Micropruina sp.]|uniref:tyrosine-type recombinase/integrase n=1 Tax=Micropruina sp. TaxID=2737536 RepID=UPI0039E36747
MSEVLNDWLSWFAASDPSPETLRLRRYQLTRFAERHPDLLAVTADDLTRWLGRPGWSTETRRSQLAALRSLYGWAHASGRIERDPSRLLPRIRPAQHQPRPAPERAIALGMLAADSRVQLMLTLAVRQGLRRGEIAQVHSDDLVEDLTGWTLRVHGKGRKQRLVPLAQDVAEQLLGVEGWAFPSPTGGHLTAGHVGVLMARALPAPWTAHSLRHAFATKAWRKSRDLLALATILGHARPETTRRYVLADVADLRSVVDAAA